MALIMFDRKGQPIRPRLSMQRKKNTAEIYVYGDIGGGGFFSDGITANQFAKDLKALGEVERIDLHLNSPGGVIFEAQAIRALLQQHKAKVITHIDGLAASAAVAIAMAGEEIRIADGGFMMIHNARGFAFGEADDMRKTADLLDKVNTQVAELYVQKTGHKLDQVLTWMDDETWMNAEEAVEKKFADQVMETAAVFNMVGQEMKFKNTPRQLQERPNTIKAAALLARFQPTIAGQKKRA